VHLGEVIFCGDSLLGLKLWETSPLDADSKTPHAWMRGNPQESAGIRLGAMRCELES